MNKQRRKKLEEIVGALDKLITALEEVQEEERDAFDNMPEGLQLSGAGEALEENASELEFKVDEIREVIEGLEQIIES